MYDLTDINQLLIAIAKMRTGREVKGVVDVLENAEALNLTDAIYNVIKNVSSNAMEQDESLLFALVQNEMAPTVNELMRAYRDISSAVAALEDIDKKLQMQARSLCAFMENRVVHISADTTANVGDQILVRCLRDMIDQNAGNVNWSTVSVRSPVSGMYIDICNRSRAIVLGGEVDFF